MSAMVGRSILVSRETSSAVAVNRTSPSSVVREMMCSNAFSNIHLLSYNYRPNAVHRRSTISMSFYGM